MEDSSETTRLLENSSLLNTTDNEVKTKMKQLLGKKVFIGQYLERRYVESLKTYKDIILVSMEEDELIKALKEIQKIVQSYYGTSKWLGITSETKDDTVVGYSLWVDLEQIPLGKHWFQIRSIKFKGKMISITVKHLKLFQVNENKVFQDMEFPVFNLKGILTYNNICEAIKFNSIMIMTIITFVINALWYLSEYSLKLTRELSFLIRALTPIFLGIIDFLSKCVGGLYLLILMLFRGNSGPPLPHNALAVAFNQKRVPNMQRKPIPYNSYKRQY
ncbi:uncharacterized protein LOC107274640 isoform X2 [Cephus cinctus]|nr:uncharacterized protein LOC107274640 isoform X2 [Cephus cinctus]